MTPAGDSTPGVPTDPPESGPDVSKSQWMRLVEADRQSIAGELHDELLPYLFAAAGALASLQRQNPDLKTALEKPVQWVDQAREIARQIMNGAALPRDLSSGPLVAAKEFLESVVLRGDDVQELSVRWKQLDESADVAWDETQAIAVYRIVCEAVRNVVRHARANQLIVAWETAPTGWAVSIQDDGEGFESETVSKTSQGITLMRQRAEAAGLRFQIVGAKDSGTQVTVFGSP
ncbi:two-component signal transduction [Rhodopirellula islandica]|uniref:histidine kinase n=1 Tax=Rhodopirellula islandica TaxID=595434 RepID=A0A0J1EKQ2_RHOIS|nr:ATP-binding protein [Rhodopirellula islandica]KLU06144.1 two-component signal transduction [Rhodopirellula islandica]